MSEYTFPKVFSYTEGSGSSDPLDTWDGKEDCRTYGCPDNEECTIVKYITDDPAYVCIKKCEGPPPPRRNADGFFTCPDCENGKWRWNLERFCRIPTDHAGFIKWPPGTNPTTHVWDDTFKRCPYQNITLLGKQSKLKLDFGDPFIRDEHQLVDRDLVIAYGYDLICPCVPKKEAAYIQQGGKYNTGQPANWTEGDFNFDGVVDILDVAEAVSQPSSTPINTQTPIADVTPTLFFVGKDPTSGENCPGEACDDYGTNELCPSCPCANWVCCPDNFWCALTLADCPSFVIDQGGTPDPQSLLALSEPYETFDPDPIVGQPTSSLSLDLDYTVTNDKPLILESNI